MPCPKALGVLSNSPFPCEQRLLGLERSLGGIGAGTRAASSCSQSGWQQPCRWAGLVLLLLEMSSVPVSCSRVEKLSPGGKGDLWRSHRTSSRELNVLRQVPRLYREPVRSEYPAGDWKGPSRLTWRHLRPD